MQKSAIGLLRRIGIIEGISYLILLFLSRCRLSIFADFSYPCPDFFGMAHGILFVSFLLNVTYCLV
ncbi:hypothetical protein GCM10020331_059250 [Ectobacillus funiculus]